MTRCPGRTTGGDPGVEGVGKTARGDKDWRTTEAAVGALMRILCPGWRTRIGGWEGRIGTSLGGPATTITDHSQVRILS